MSSTATSMPPVHSRGGRDLACLLLVLGAILVGLSCWPHIWTRGEAREALVVRDILRHGHWILAWRNGVLASKPPLFHWIAALIGGVIGLSDSVVRLPSVIGALVCVVVTFRLGEMSGGLLRAWLGVGVLLGCYGFWSSAVDARVDMLFAACVAIALEGYWRWERLGASAGRVACYLGAAAATLTKGPAGALLPLLVILAYNARPGGASRLHRVWSPGLAALALGIILAWYALAYQRGGEAFVAKQLLSENFDRFVGRGAFVHRRSHHPLKLVGGYFSHLFPWSTIALVRVALGRRDPGDSSRRFLCLWLVTVVTVFCLGAGKRSVYLLPIYPAVAVLAAEQLERWAPRVSRTALIVMMLIFDIAVLSATQVHRVRSAGHDPLAQLVMTVRERLPEDVTLFASPGVEETDVIVTAWAADREILRRRLRCAPRHAWLVAPSKGGVAPPQLGPDANVLAVTERRLGRPIVLVRCAEQAL